MKVVVTFNCKDGTQVERIVNIKHNHTTNLASLKQDLGGDVPVYVRVVEESETIDDVLEIEAYLRANDLI